AAGRIILPAFGRARNTAARPQIAELLDKARASGIRPCTPTRAREFVLIKPCRNSRRAVAVGTKPVKPHAPGITGGNDALDPGLRSFEPLVAIHSDRGASHHRAVHVVGWLASETASLCLGRSWHGVDYGHLGLPHARQAGRHELCLRRGIWAA